MRSAKPLLPARLAESTESLAIDLVYVLQVGMCQIFALVPNSGRNSVFVFGRIVSSERIRIVSLYMYSAASDVCGRFHSASAKCFLSDRLILGDD